MAINLVCIWWLPISAMVFFIFGSLKASDIEDALKNIKYTYISKSVV